MMSASNSSLRKIERGGGVLISEVVTYTNLTFETDESVLFIEVSSNQRYPYILIATVVCVCVCVTTIPYSFGWCHRCKTMHRCPPGVPIFKGGCHTIGEPFPWTLKDSIIIIEVEEMD